MSMEFVREGCGACSDMNNFLRLRFLFWSLWEHGRRQDSKACVVHTPFTCWEGRQYDSFTQFMGVSVVMLFPF